MGNLYSPAIGRITSGFGPRQSPGGIGSTNHKGVDIADNDDAIVAAANGKVIKSAYNESRGNYITLDIGGGVTVLVQHLASRGVAVGADVSAGQWLGKEGKTGTATGVHCHVEVTVDNVIVNPSTWFAEHGVALGSTGTGSWNPNGGSSGGGGQADPATRVYQEQNNRYGAAGLKEDGINGPFTKAWREWVKIAQDVLNDWKTQLPKLVPDGDYRYKTHERTREFQRRNNLPVTGFLSNSDCAYMRSKGSKIPNRPKTH